MPHACIGITGSTLTRGGESRESAESGCYYVDAVLKHGGTPIIFPSLQDLAIVERLCSICHEFRETIDVTRLTSM